MNSSRDSLALGTIIVAVGLGIGMLMARGCEQVASDRMYKNCYGKPGDAPAGFGYRCDGTPLR